MSFVNTTMCASNVNFGTLPYPQKEVTADGIMLIGSTAAPNIRPGTLTSPGGTVTIGYASPNITLDVAGAGFTWSVIAVNTPGLINHGYIANAAATIQVSLPAAAVVGSEIAILRNLNGGGQWQITQGAGQQILAGNTATTVGAGGTLTSTNNGDAVTIVCVVANTTWAVLNSVGNLTVV